MKHVVKVISLTRSVERRERFSQANAHVAFTFFDAIDGAQLYHELNHTPDLFEPGLRYNAGAMGCATSHLMLWQEAASGETPFTIVEDDAVLRHDFHEQSANILASLDPEWDMVVWGWNFDSILSLNIMPDVSPAVVLFDQQKMRGANGAFQQMSGTPAVLRLDKCFGTPAYSISPRGARKFLLNCLPLKNFEVFFPVLNRALPNNGIDIAMNRIYSQTVTYCSLPPLAITNNDHGESLIQR
jgi:GR25 family glycosyltransferase involved in LPS biosynthesis